MTLAALPGSGCGESNQGTSEHGGPKTVAEFSELYADARCSDAVACCAAGNWAHDVDGCRVVKASTFRLVNGHNPIHFDAVAAEQCLTELRARAQSCGSRLPVACRRVFYGDTAPGAPCSDEGDCALPDEGYATCLGKPGSRACFVHVRGGVGDACGSSESNVEVDCDLDPALYCDSSSYTCQPRRALGAACAPAHEACVDGAYCAASGTCVPALAAGEPCDGAGCLHGFCNANTNVCTNHGPDTCYVPL